MNTKSDSARAGPDLWMPLEESRWFVASEIDRWNEYIRASGVKPE